MLLLHSSSVVHDFFKYIHILNKNLPTVYNSRFVVAYEADVFSCDQNKQNMLLIWYGYRYI